MMRLFRSQPAINTNVRLEGIRVVLRPPADRDWRGYAELRSASRKFLEPWEPTWPSDALTREAFQRRLSRYATDWRDDVGYSFFLYRMDDGELLGGVSLSNVRRGVARAGTLGYWVGETHAGQGHMSEALQLVLDFAYGTLGLHRVEAACLPHNEPSQRLLRSAGFMQEGYAHKYLKIRGDWQDHLLFALLAEHHNARTLGAPGGG